MLEYREKDSVDRIIYDYVNGAFPVEFWPGYTGPRNITFGKNREKRELVSKLRRSGVQAEEVLKTLLNDKPTGKVTDEFYVDLIQRYINLVVPGRDEDTDSLQIDFHDMYFGEVEKIVTNGFGMDAAFKYVVMGEVPITSVVIVNPKQYVKTNKKS